MAQQAAYSYCLWVIFRFYSYFLIILFCSFACIMLSDILSMNSPLLFCINQESMSSITSFVVISYSLPYKQSFTHSCCIVQSSFLILYRSYIQIIYQSHTMYINVIIVYQICAFNIIDQQMTTTTDQKQSIMGLPLQERAVAVALKHIFDKIKQLEDQENQQIQKLHHSFISRFKVVETNASNIIRGSPIDEKYLASSDKYFTKEEQTQVKQIANRNKGIEAYWLTALINHFKEQLSLPDKQIASNIRDISTNVTEDSLEVVFVIGKNEWLEEGTIKRRFILEEGAATKVEGDNAKWLKEELPQGIFGVLLSDIPDFLPVAFAFAGEFINEVVPYSLQYFLGANEEEQQDEQQDEEEQDDEEEEEEAPTKKRKQ